MDGTGNVFVIGFTDSGNFPTQNAGNFFQGTNGGSHDAFILKFDNLGNRLWATWYGGSGDDYGSSIATDVSGNVFVAGNTDSHNFPVQNAGTFFQGTNAGGTDAFILKFDNLGNRLWATFYGGSGNEYNFLDTYDNLAIDNCGNVYVSFETKTNPFPHLTNSCDAGYYDNSYNGGTYDIVLSLFSNTGSLLWSTYWGGNSWDCRSPLAVDASNNLFVSGEWLFLTSSGTYPVTDPGGGAYYDPTFNGGQDDGFIAKFCSNACICSPYNGCVVSSILSVTAASTNVLCNGQCTGTATANPSGGTSPFTYSWNTNPAQSNQTAIGLCAGNYIVTVTDALNTTVIDTVTITQPPLITATTNSTSTPGGTATVTPLGGTPPYTYSWNTIPAQTTQMATQLEEGIYCCAITDANNCIDTICVTVTVMIEDSCGTIYIPNAFTPNNNDLNEVFKPIVSCVHNYRFLIFNRWGEKLYETTNISEGWNGYYKGEICKQDVYAYKIVFTDDTKNELHQYVGKVTLLR